MSMKRRCFCVAGDWDGRPYIRAQQAAPLHSDDHKPSLHSGAVSGAPTFRRPQAAPTFGRSKRRPYIPATTWRPYIRARQAAPLHSDDHKPPLHPGAASGAPTFRRPQAAPTSGRSKRRPYVAGDHMAPLLLDIAFAHFTRTVYYLSVTVPECCKTYIVTYLIGTGTDSYARTRKHCIKYMDPTFRRMLHFIS